MWKSKATLLSLDEWYECMTNMELEALGTQNKDDDCNGVKHGSVLFGKIPAHPEALANSEL